MALTSDSTDSTATAILTVRTPRDSDKDLVTDAERRLGRIRGIKTVTVEGLRGIEPGLSATAVTVTVSVESTVTVAELRDSLAETTAVEAIEDLDGIES